MFTNQCIAGFRFVCKLVKNIKSAAVVTSHDSGATEQNEVWREDGTKFMKSGCS